MTALSMPTLPPQVATDASNGWLIQCCERGWLPNGFVRAGIRALMCQRLRDEGLNDGELHSRHFNALLDELHGSPIAIETGAADMQHYELPPTFFEAHLGPQLKYSCALHPNGNETLTETEEAMFACYAERTSLANGQCILDLGCGWGSLSLRMAKRYPNARVVALSNSWGQRSWIEARAAERGLTNLIVHTRSIVDSNFAEMSKGGLFDRVVSIEMSEHMKNYGLLLGEIVRWMRPDAVLFVHIFAYRMLVYHFQMQDGTDWMSKYFFIGGTMPSEALLPEFQDDLRMARYWWISGMHYTHTIDHWLANLDAARDRLMPVFIQIYGRPQATVWFQRWHMFCLAVSTLFGYIDGNERGVTHYRFVKHQGVEQQSGRNVSPVAMLAHPDQQRHPYRPTDCQGAQHGSHRRNMCRPKHCTRTKQEQAGNSPQRQRQPPSAAQPTKEDIRLDREQHPQRQQPGRCEPGPQRAMRIGDGAGAYQEDFPRCRQHHSPHHQPQSPLRLTGLSQTKREQYGDEDDADPRGVARDTQHAHKPAGLSGHCIEESTMRTHQRGLHRIILSGWARYLAVIALALASAACSGPPPNPNLRAAVPLHTVSVGLPRYMGRWYIIASIPYFGKWGNVGSYAEWSLRPDGRIDDAYAYRPGSLDAPFKRMQFVDSVVDGSGGGEWRVQLFWPIYVSQLTLYVGPEYHVTLLDYSDKSPGWVLSREPSTSNADYRATLGRSGAMGYDILRFRRVPQFPSQIGQPDFQSPGDPNQLPAHQCDLPRR